MQICFLIIAILGIFYFILNVFQAKNKINSNFLNENLNQLFYLIFGLIAFCEIFYVFIFLANDFSYSAVYQNSSINQPIIYKIVATYSGQGGSFLFWNFAQILIGFLLIKSKYLNKNEKEFKYNFNIIKSIFIIFPTILSLILYFNNPFELTLNKFPELIEIPTDEIGRASCRERV